MDLGLTGKHAVVTGASRGIGFAVARGLVAEGVDVALVARHEEHLARAAEELRAHADACSGRVVTLTCDTADDDAVQDMARAAEQELGGVDVLVNCAAPGGSMRDEDLDEHLNVKVKGYLRCARAFAPGMARRGWGRIVNVSGLNARSTGSVVGSVRNVAVAAMTKNLADEYGGQGINVTVVHPGLTRTDSTVQWLTSMAETEGITLQEAEASASAGNTIGRLVTPDELASVIVFLASPLSVAITGDAIAAGGGVRGSIHY